MIRNTPAVFHRYIIRNCLDSIKVSLCDVSGLADPISDTYLHVLTPAAARGSTQCGISNDDACGLRSEIIATYPMGFVCNGHPVVSSLNPRGSLPLAADDTLIIVVQRYRTSTSGTEYRIEITEYPYDPSSAPTLPQPPYFSYDTSRVCWTGSYRPRYLQYRNHHAGYPAQLVCQWHAGLGCDRQYLRSSVQRPWYLHGGGRADLSAKFSLLPPPRLLGIPFMSLWILCQLPISRWMGGSTFPEAMPASVAVVVACVSNTRPLS
jgi:hypothetical protein